MRPTPQDLANQEAAEKAAKRPGVLIGSAYAARSITGGRITEEQRIAIFEGASEALAYFDRIATGHEA